MDFGYFTLSDNHYLSNTRTSNQFVADITAEALYAEELRMHSVWIGEHHFSSLGVLSCPDVVLAYIAARTRHVRLAPAVTGAVRPKPLAHTARCPSSAARSRSSWAGGGAMSRTRVPRGSSSRTPRPTTCAVVYDQSGTVQLFGVVVTFPHNPTV